MGFFNRKKNIVHEGGQALVKLPKRESFALTGKDDTKRPKLLKIYRQAYDTVPLITAIIDVQADQTVQPFFFEGPNKEKLQKWADKVNAGQFKHRLSKVMLIYGDGFVEMVDEVPKLLNSEYMHVFRSATGDVTGYSQIIGDKKTVLWGTTGNKQEDKKYTKNITKIDSIVHFPHNVIGSDKYGTSVIRSLIGSLNSKIDMENNLKKVLFKYVAPLIWAKVGNNEFPANQSIVDDISSTLRDLQAESEVTTSHLVELGVLDFNAKGMDIETPIKHIEQQIITGGQVPPVLLGREGADKAAEVQLRSFGRHIKANQREIKNIFEDKIIVGQGLGTPEDKLIWQQSEEREWEIEVDNIRGLVTDGILTPQKANDLLPPRFHEELPEMPDPLNGQEMGEDGLQKPRASQKKDTKVKDNPNDPTKASMNKDGPRKRRVKSDRAKTSK